MCSLSSEGVLKVIQAKHLRDLCGSSTQESPSLPASAVILEMQWEEQNYMSFQNLKPFSSSVASRLLLRSIMHLLYPN